MLYHPPMPEGAYIDRVGPYGKRYNLPDDSAEHWLHFEQRWLPHAIESSDHPFVPGQIVSVRDGYLQHYIKVAAVRVSRVRAFRYHRYAPYVHQIEILGLPLQWWAAGHFEP